MVERWQCSQQCAGCSIDSRDADEHEGTWLRLHLTEMEHAYREQATLDELRLAGLASSV